MTATRAKWLKWAYRSYFLCRILPNDGTYIVDEEWDNLIILDACRYDTFRRTNSIRGRLESRISRGSDTTEFLTENFLHNPRCAYFADVIYVAANPFVTKLLRDRIFKIYPVWDYGWDDDLKTVPPDRVVEEAVRAHSEHPEKRLIAHFVQPHFPYLGSRIAGDTGLGIARRQILSPNGSAWVPDTNLDQLLEKGKLDKSMVVSAYVDNLKIVLPHVKELISKLDGVTVVTSDHGNMFGERPSVLYPFRVFSHPDKLHVNQLIQVPWLIVNKD